MTEPADTRPRVIVPITQLEKLAMAIDFAYAQALDPSNGLPMVLPAAKIAELFPDWKDAGPQEVSLITAMIVLEWLSGHKVISRGGIDKRRPRSSKPPDQMRKCSHCGTLARLPDGKCMWCGEKSNG